MGEFIQTLTDKELNSLREQAATGGEYEASRGLLEREYQRRALAIQAMHTVDMPVADPAEYIVPVDPMDDLQCESCQ